MTRPRGLFKRTPKLELRADTVLLGSAEIARAISATALVLSSDGSRGEDERTNVEVIEPGVVR